MLVYTLTALAGAGLAWLATNLRVVKQFEQGVIFRFGRVQKGIRGPGLTWSIPIADRMQKVNMQIVTMPVPAQDGITRDNVTVRVDAVVYSRSPTRCGWPSTSRVPVGDRSGGADVASIDHRQERPRRSAVQSRAPQRRSGVDARQPGVGLGRTHRPRRDQGRGVAGFDEALDLPPGRAGARATRRVITADGESRRRRSCRRLQNHERTPGALQLRLLQTVVEVAAEKNSTLVIPFPVELLRFLEKSTPQSTAGRGQRARVPDDPRSLMP